MPKRIKSQQDLDELPNTCIKKLADSIRIPRRIQKKTCQAVKQDMYIWCKFVIRNASIYASSRKTKSVTINSKDIRRALKLMNTSVLG